MIEHPLEVGTPIYHVKQEGWARELPGGTAIVVEAHGPAVDGSWEYEVIANQVFSEPPHPTQNPTVRPALWPGATVRLAAPDERGEQGEGLAEDEAAARVGELLASLDRRTPEQRQALLEQAAFAEISFKLELEMRPPQEGERDV